MLDEIVRVVSRVPHYGCTIRTYMYIPVAHTISMHPAILYILHFIQFHIFARAAYEYAECSVVHYLDARKLMLDFM